MSHKFLSATLFLAVAGLAACSTQGPLPAAVTEDDAVAYCRQQGGTPVTQQVQSRSVEMCKFPGGTLINAKGLYRKDHPGSQAK